MLRSVRATAPYFEFQVGRFRISPLRPDFTSNIVHGLAFGTPKNYIAPYDKINHGLVNLSCNCDVKSGIRVCTNLELLRLRSERQYIILVLRSCVLAE